MVTLVKLTFPTPAGDGGVSCLHFSQMDPQEQIEEAVEHILLWWYFIELFILDLKTE